MNMLRKIGQNFQIALPQQIVKILGLKINEYIDISVQDSRIILEPQVLVPKDQAYFYSQEWQKDEEEASKDLKRGKVTKTKNLDELFKKLDP